MSLSMLLGRVVLPACGLAIGALLAAQFVSSGRLNLSSWTLSGGPEKNASPGSSSHTGPTDGPTRIVAEGRVVAYPGAQVVMSASVAGTIGRVLVHEKSVVHKGDLLIEFKSKDVEAQLAEAEARLAEAEVDVARAESDDRRLQVLSRGNAAPRQDYERVHFNLLALRSRRDALKAMCSRLEAVLDKYHIVSPIDGVVTSRVGQPGETVNIAAPIVTIVDLSRLRIEAEVDEYDIANAAVGASVNVTAEGYADQSWPGRIEEISDVLVGRRIRPEDPGRPTDTRVLPVRITLRGPTPLKFGQRVEVEINGRANPPKGSQTSAGGASGRS